MRTSFASILLLLAGRCAPIAAEIMTYAIDMIGKNLPEGALEKVYDNPHAFFQAFEDAVPGTFYTLPGDPIIDPHPATRKLRGSEQRDLQISTCNPVKYPRLCTSATISASDTTSSTTLTVDAGVRKLFPASIKTSALKGITTAISAKLKKGLCDGVPSCKIDLQITQLS